MSELPSRQRLRPLRWTARAAVFLVAAPVVLCLGVWSMLAIYFSNLPGELLRTAAAAVFGGGFALAFLLLRRRLRTLLCFFLAFLAILIWWTLIPASHDRDWQTSVARVPRAEFEGSRVTVRDIRNFDYRTPEDFTVRYYDKTYDLEDLQTVDFVKSHWDKLEGVAHTLLSFGFRTGDYLTVSVETRPEKGEPQGALRGLFKQYELIYVLGDERDLIRLRTSFRGEDVYLYPTTSTPEEVRLLFLDILKKVNDIHERPQFYNVLMQNCTTSLVPHVQKIQPRRHPWWKFLLNGHTDRMAYEGGWIRRWGSFEETKERHHVNKYVKDTPDAPDFSLRIRPHLEAR